MDHEPDFVRDTDPKALEVFYEIQRRRSPGEKANDVFELTDWMIQLAERGVRMRYPDISEREVFSRRRSTNSPRLDDQGLPMGSGSPWLALGTLRCKSAPC